MDLKDGRSLNGFFTVLLILLYYFFDEVPIVDEVLFLFFPLVEIG